MADIFISYSQKDRSWAKRLVDALTAEGWDVWWDLNIRSGESFDVAIERKLKQVRCVVVVWSSSAVESRWVRAEAAWAADQKKVVSIRIEDDLELPLKFYLVQTELMVGWDGARNAAAFRKLVTDIGVIAGPPVATVPESSPAVFSKQRTEPESAPSSKIVSPFRVRSWIRSWSKRLGELKQEEECEKSNADGTSRKPGQVFRDTLKDGSEGPEMVVIPAGSFEMGSNEGRSNERPVHQVTVARFAMGKYPVTFEEYDYFLKEHDYFAHAMGRGLSDGMGWGGRSPPCDQRQLERCRDVR